MKSLEMNVMARKAKKKDFFSKIKIAFRSTKIIQITDISVLTRSKVGLGWMLGPKVICGIKKKEH